MPAALNYCCWIHTFTPGLWGVQSCLPQRSTQAVSGCPTPAVGMEPLSALAHAAVVDTKYSSLSGCRGSSHWLQELLPQARSLLSIPLSDFRHWPQIHTYWLPSSWHLFLEVHREITERLNKPGLWWSSVELSQTSANWPRFTPSQPLKTLFCVTPLGCSLPA